MKLRIAALGGVLAVLLGATACTGDDPETPDAAETPTASTAAGDETATASADPSASDDADPMDAETVLTEAQRVVRNADAVAIATTRSLVRDSSDVSIKTTSTWSSDPAAWQTMTLIDLEEVGISGGQNYTLAYRFVDNAIYTRSIGGQWSSPGWYRVQGAQSVPPPFRADYPVLPLLTAEAVGVVEFTDGTIVKAEVPNDVIDLWFELSDQLNEDGLPGVMDGGHTTVSIAVDDSGFPTELTCRGSDVELKGDIPDYVKENLAASRLTMRFEPTHLPTYATAGAPPTGN